MNKKPPNIREELKFSDGVFHSVREINDHMVRISQTLANASDKIEELENENCMLRKEVKQLRKTK